MKKLLIWIFIFIISNPLLGWGASLGTNYVRMHLYLNEAQGVRDYSGGPLNAATEKLGVRFISTTTSAITDVDLDIDMNGSPTTVNFKMQIETDSSGSPSGTALGTATASFNVSADGLVGLKALGSGTGALTVGTAYWLVIYDNGDGGAPDGSNYIEWRHNNNSIYSDREYGRHYNGTDWTTTALEAYRGGIVLKHADASYTGMAIDSGTGTSAVDPTTPTNIYDTNKQGVRLKFGSKVIIQGVSVYFRKTGAPSDVTITVYENTTSKYSEVITAADISDRNPTFVWFASPVALASDTNLYIVASCAGCTAGNDWDAWGWSFSTASGYQPVFMPADYDFVYGTGSPPTTVLNGFSPIAFEPAFTVLSTDFDETAGGASNCTFAQ
jgi:hypothetical protein